MKSFVEALRERVLIFDGSMGALLASMGQKAICPDILSVDRPDVIRGVHRAYIDAGADVVIADTFGSTRVKLAKCGLGDRVDEIVGAAVRNAREAAGDRAYVALDLGPTGDMLYPLGTLETRNAIEAYAQQIRAGRGADFAFMETMTDIGECRAAMLAAREVGMPFAASFSFEPGGRTMTGGSPECAAILAESLGAIAVGMNCSGGPEHMLAPLCRMRALTRLPIVVQPNAGLPEIRGGETLYPFGPERFEEEMRAILEGGAAAVGGCCGTTPEHIRRLANLAKAWPAARPAAQAEEYVCSARAFSPLATAIENRVLAEEADDLYDMEDSIALAVLDLRGLNAREAADAASDAQTATHAPLGFVADGAEALEAALREYAGIAAVSAPDDCAAILPKYGAKRMPAL